MINQNSEAKFGWKDLIKSVWFLLNLGELGKKYLANIIFLFILLLYTVVPPLIVGLIVNFFTSYKPGDSFNRFYFLSILLGGSIIVVSFLRLTAKKNLGLMLNNLICQIRVRGFELMLSESLLKSSKKATGEKVQKIQNGLDSVSTFFRILTNQILLSVASLIGIFSIFVYIRFYYVFFFLSYILVFVIILRFFNTRLQDLNLEKNQAMEKASGAYVEGLANISTLKSLGSEKSFETQIIKKENISKKYLDKITRVSNNKWKTFQIFNGVSVGLFLFLVGRDVLVGNLNIGEIVIFYSYLDRLMSISDQIMGVFNDLLQSKAGIERLIPIFQRKMEEEKGRVGFPRDWDEIVITNGEFLYKPEVGIKNINFKVKKGEKIGIIGKTGSGKSTLIKVLLGLYKLKKGEYRIDGRDFYSIRSERIFENISVVPQEVEMFNLTFEENITLFRSIDPVLLEKAIATAQLQEVIDHLPQGLDTIIGEKGFSLSGGERQRLAIARAICQNGQILILDEATSSLDTKTENLIFRALEENFPQKTVIAIAHKTGTLANTDRLYVLERGEIAEEGKYAELINDEKSFLYSVSQKTA